MSDTADRSDLEDAIDPEIPFIDTHFHLWASASEGLLKASGRKRYLIDDYVADADGHNLIAAVHVDGPACHRSRGLPAFRPVGETEFAAGQGAIADSGQFGSAHIAAGIVGACDLTLPEAGDVLEAHMAAGNGRFRGIRVSGAWDEDRSIIGGIMSPPKDLYASPAFHKGFTHLERLGLSFDAFVLSPQLPEVAALAKAFPNVRIVLNHVGNPVGIGRYKGKMQEMFPQWKRDMEAIAELPNVWVKLGGLGTFVSAFPSFQSDPPAPSRQIAEEWRPYIETAIEAFGPSRGMFESNYPVDGASGSFRTVMNALKRIAANHSAAEKRTLFADTAAGFYRLDLGTITPT